MVAGLVPAVPGGIVHAKASEISGQNATAEPHIHCVCGTNNLATGDHTTHGNITWNGVSSLSDITQDGSYYLTKPVTLKATWTCDYNVNLCLNGNSITCDASNSDTIVINKDKTFILTDCQENAGKITHGESKTGRGIYNYRGTFQMYEGTISGNTGTYGGGVNSTWGKFNMYGGTITGNIGSTGAYGSGYGGSARRIWLHKDQRKTFRNRLFCICDLNDDAISGYTGAKLSGLKLDEATGYELEYMASGYFFTV